MTGSFGDRALLYKPGAQEVLSSYLDEIGCKWLPAWHRRARG